MFISNEYLSQQRQLHEERNDYGVASLEYATQVAQFIERLGADEFGEVSILDYGCGKGRLALGLSRYGFSVNVDVTGYDPAVPQFATRPDRRFDAVVSIDVLEHIEPEHLVDVIRDIRFYATRSVFLSIHCGPARKHLPDGRNAHLIQKPPAWWLELLMSYFTPTYFAASPGGGSCVFIGVPKKE